MLDVLAKNLYCRLGPEYEAWPQLESHLMVSRDEQTKLEIKSLEKIELSPLGQTSRSQEVDHIPNNWCSNVLKYCHYSKIGYSMQTWGRMADHLMT